jgi:dihydroorotate dehydrogenase
LKKTEYLCALENFLSFHSLFPYFCFRLILTALYKYLVKPFLFLFQPETAHHITFSFITFLFRIPGVPSIFRSIYVVKDKRLERTVFGITFPNPVGLAAGFDKDARIVDEFACLGFGFIEI